jgi:hypothetical protein
MKAKELQTEIDGTTIVLATDQCWSIKTMYTSVYQS